MEFVHKSVLLEESINWLITDKDGIYVDCTMGGAGHSKGFAMQLSSRGTLVAIDQDDDAIAAASVRLQGLPCKIKIAKSNFKNFDDVLDGLVWIRLMLWLLRDMIRRVHLYLYQHQKKILSS